MPRRRNPTGSIAKFDPGDEPWRCCAELVKEPGHRCKQKAEPGRRTCRFHAGRCDGPRPTTGRHSSVMSRLLGTYERNLSSADLLDIREPLALLDAVVHRCVERAGEFDTPEFRKCAKALYRAAKKAHDKEETDEFDEAFGDLGALIKRGSSEDSALMTLVHAVQAQGKMVNDAWDKHLRRGEAIARGDLILLVSTMLSVMHGAITRFSSDRGLSAKDSSMLASLVSEHVEQRVFVPSGMSQGATGEGYMIGEPAHEVADEVYEAPVYEPEQSGSEEP